MKRILSLIAALSLLMVVSGCGIGDMIKERFAGDEGETHTDVIREEESHDAANAINICMYDFDTFNPIISSSQSVKDAMKFVYEPLFTLDGELNAVPVLAENYTVSDDGKSIAIALKDNVVWHDGTAFTSADAVYTINKIINAQTTYTATLDEVAGCRAIDNTNIEITFKHSLPNAAALFTFPIVKNRTPMEVDAAFTPIGTGPFSYYGKIGVDRYMLVASDYYYKGKAAMSGVYIDIVPDNERYFTMFDSGNSDVCNGDLIEDYEYTPKGSMQTNEYISNDMIYLGINNESYYLSGKNIRRALACLIDRVGIEENVMYSRVKAVDVPINPASPYYCGGDKMRVDTVRGGELIEADGWSAQTKGYTKTIEGKSRQLKLSFLVNGDSEDDVKIAEKIAEGFNLNGIKIVIDKQNYETFLQKIESKSFDIFLGTYRMPASLDVTAFAGRALNMFSYDNITVDMIMNQMGISREPDELKALFEQLRDVLDEDMPAVSIAYKKGRVFTSARIKNVSAIGADAFYRDLHLWSIK